MTLSMKNRAGAPGLPVGRVLRLSTFQIGSAMGDILVASVWNRIMISELGIPAWPVGLLIALRYLLSPLSLWAGHRSDTKRLWGWQRTSYIWLGRGLIVVALPFLGLSFNRLAVDQGDPVGWLLAFFSFLLYGVGTLISGSPFLALVRDSAPPSKKGLAITVIETALITFYPLVAIGFGQLVQTYHEQIFWQLIWLTVIAGGFFWFFAIVGQEKRQSGAVMSVAALVPVRETFKRIWGDGRTRLFFLFLSLATMAAWMQDNVLEPYGADVFGLDIRQTTRFTGYWGTATVLTLVLCFGVLRKRRPETLTDVAQGGLLAMAVGMVLLVLSAPLGQSSLLYLGLLIFGAGFGVYTFGGVSLMAVMSPEPHSGAYLGLWSISILIFKGLGTFLGGVARDVLLLGMSASPAVAYGAVFVLSAAGLLGAMFLVRHLDVVGFLRDTRPQHAAPAEVPAVSMEF